MSFEESVAPRRISAPLNRYGLPNIEPKYLEQDLRRGWEEHLKPI